MKLGLTTFIIILLNITLEAQADWIFPYEKDGLYGYTNSCADIITEAIFEEAAETRGGLALIKFNGRYGFINNEGKIAIKPKYIQASEFNMGIASVTKPNGKKIAITPDNKRYKGFPKELHGTHRVCTTPILHQENIIQKDNKYGFVMDKYSGRLNGKIQYVSDTLYPKFDTVVAVTHQLMYVKYNSKFSFVFEGQFVGGAAYIDSTLNFQYDEIVLFPCRFHAGSIQI